MKNLQKLGILYFAYSLKYIYNNTIKQQQYWYMNFIIIYIHVITITDLGEIQNPKLFLVIFFVFYFINIIKSPQLK